MTDPQLFHFQKIGAEWLASKQYALLGDEMGIGKTAQAIAGCSLVNARRILVICPAIVTENWVREFEKFWPLFRVLDVELTIASYDGLTRNLGRFKLGEPYDVLICDEAHYLKNPAANRTRAVFGNGGISRMAKRVWCLTGTPAPNHAGELWVMLLSFGMTTLPYDDFVDRYCESVAVGNFRRQITGSKVSMIREVRDLLAPVLLRRTKIEVLPELPDLLFGEIFVEPQDDVLPPDVRERYFAECELMTEKLGLSEFGSPESEREMILMLEGMAQSVSTLRRYAGVQKAQGVGLQIAEELDQKAYDKVIIFAVHHDVIEILKRHFPNPAVVTGKTAKSHRQAEIDRFQNDPECRVFIGNIQAAGTGPTLTAAHQVVFVEQDWVPGNNAQAVMRAHRIGQYKNVTARFVRLRGSIDEKITWAIQRKTRELALLFNPHVQ